MRMHVERSATVGDFHLASPQAAVSVMFQVILCDFKLRQVSKWYTSIFYFISISQAFHIAIYSK